MKRHNFLYCLIVSICSLFALNIPARAQSVYPIAGTIRDQQGNVIPAATVIILSGNLSTVNTSTQPGSPLATIYSDPAGTMEINQNSNPAATTGTGQFVVYAASGYYVVQAYRNGFQLVAPTAVEVGTGCITSGTNVLIKSNGSSGCSASSVTDNGMTITFTEPAIFTDGLTACINNTVRYVDPANTCGWSGSDLAAWWNAAIASLPTDSSSYPYGTIMLGTGSYTISSGTANDHSPRVNIIGTGSSAVTITCTYNGDCINTQVYPFVISPGRRIGGFTLLGDGSSVANGVGFHAGDSVGTEFFDIATDNFNGTSGACWRWDNLNGWFERNLFIQDEIGLDPSAGGTQAGCTKLIRITNSGGASNPSFTYDSLYGVRLSILGGDIGFSVEGTSNPPAIQGNFWQGSSNTYNGATIFDFQGNTYMQSGQVYWTTECTTCSGADTTTIWALASGTTVHYQGQVVGDSFSVNSNSGTLTNDISEDNVNGIMYRGYVEPNTYNPANVVASGQEIYQTSNNVDAAGPNIFLGSFGTYGGWGEEYTGAGTADQYWCTTNNGSPNYCVERMRLKANGNLTLTGSVIPASYGTSSNCSSSASPAVCGSAAAGAFNIPASASSVVVDTSAVTANSDIQILFNSALGTRLSVTCNTTAQQPYVTAISAGTSFTVSVPSNFSSNPGCFTYTVTN